MSKKIPLQNGMFAIVDAEDYERVDAIKWVVRSNGTTTQVIGTVNGVTEPLGRFILGANGKKRVTQKNGEWLNFKKDNMQEEHVNSITWSTRASKGTSNYKGVSWSKSSDKWMVQISKGSDRYYLGTFTNEDEAAKSYNEKAKELFGEYAYINKIGEDNSAHKVNVSKVKQHRKRVGSKYKGITQRKNGKWVAQIRHGKKYGLGSFESKEEAAKAYDKKAIEIYGDKAILNFPKELNE